MPTRCRLRVCAKIAFVTIALPLRQRSNVAEPPAHSPPAGVGIDWKTSPLDLDLRGMQGGRCVFRCPHGKPQPAHASFTDPHVDGEVKTIAVHHDGKLLLGGNFTHVGGQPRHSLARLNDRHGFCRCLHRRRRVGDRHPVGWQASRWWRLRDYSTDGTNFTAATPMTRVANGRRASAPHNVHGARF